MRPFEPISQQLFLTLVSSIFSYATIRSILSHLHSLGKSKNTLKKIKKEYSLRQRFWLQHIKEAPKKYYPKQIHFFYRIHTIYLIVFTFSFVLILISIFIKEWTTTSYFITMGKCFTCDLPLLIFFTCKTKGDKIHGGVKWKYEKY